ncbi:predicted protein [Lichtheimia corymbifera JMRC:FSU:9682]|uniref:Uncharacterized protein n=1 Tax=Lichtheimia corymbifera JMRC:FSU:9682 TaxID=1263082 RepID=A0A068S9N8_9FUNG|nr:predicted protein [Lichtheimia corymbifera JMRC:FSU:9682]
MATPNLCHHGTWPVPSSHPGNAQPLPVHTRATPTLCAHAPVCPALQMVYLLPVSPKQLSYDLLLAGISAPSYRGGDDVANLHVGHPCEYTSP